MTFPCLIKKLENTFMFIKTITKGEMNFPQRRVCCENILCKFTSPPLAPKPQIRRYRLAKLSRGRLTTETCIYMMHMLVLPVDILEWNCCCWLTLSLRLSLGAPGSNPHGNFLARGAWGTCPAKAIELVSQTKLNNIDGERKLKAVKVVWRCGEKLHCRGGPPYTQSVHK